MEIGRVVDGGAMKEDVEVDVTRALVYSFLSAQVIFDGFELAKKFVWA